MADWHYHSLSDVCRRMKSGELSARTLTEQALERIRALEPSLRSFATVLEDQALETAERCDRERAEGRPLGPLHGVPVAVKDLLNTEGCVTASGTRVMRDFVPDHDATVVSRLRAAGAVLVGKTQLTEGAFAAHHPDVTPPVNPWNAAYWPGVSSSGSGVSVAAGLAFASLGTDTGGSIRFPSAMNGLVGIKPTYGRVSRFGAFPLAESLDHIGPMARSVEDAARVLGVLAGEDPNDPTTLAATVPAYAQDIVRDLPSMRIGVDWSYVGDGVQHGVADLVERALDVFRGLGATVREVSMPEDVRRLSDGWSATCGVECARAHASYYPARREEYGPALSSLIETGMTVSADEYQSLERSRERFRGELDVLLDTVDVLIAPAMPVLSPTADSMDRAVADDEVRVAFVQFTAPFDYSGHPTISLPLELDAAGVPQGIQLIGRALGEPTLVRAGSAFEAAVGFEVRPPCE